MTDRIKSISEKKIENALNIDDDIENLDKSSSKNEANNIEEDMAAKIEERKRHGQEIRERLENIKNNSANNEEFADAIFKELVITDLEILTMVRSELDINPSPRYLETISAMSNGVVTAVNALRDIGKTRHNQEIDVKKLEIRDKVASGGALTAAGGMAASFADVIKAAKNLVDANNAEKETIKTVEAEVSKEEDVIIPNFDDDDEEPPVLSPPEENS